MDPEHSDSLGHRRGRTRVFPHGLMAGRSRRTALGRLLSAVLGLLLSRTGVVETAARRHPAHHLQERKARRRQKHDAAVKRRRRQQRQDRPGGGAKDLVPNQRGISLLLRNPSSARATIHIETGELNFVSSCSRLAVFDIPPGESRLFDTSSSIAYAWIANRYYLEFENPFIGTPYIHAGYDGSGFTLPPNHCFLGGTLVVKAKRLGEGDGVFANLAGHTFTIGRQGDKADFKYFIVDLPATL